MKIKPLNTYNPSFGIYLKTKPTQYGHMISGKYKGNSIDVYTAYENGYLRHKLYYVKNAAGNWLKSKLKFYYHGEYIGQSRAENVGKNLNVSR